MKIFCHLFLYSFIGLFCSIVLLSSCSNNAHKSSEKKPLVLLLCKENTQNKELIAMSIGIICKKNNIDFDLYFTMPREGGIFSRGGSAVMGGGHRELLGTILSQFNTTVINIDSVSLFQTQLKDAATVYHCPANVVDVCNTLKDKLGLKIGSEVLAVQTQQLPEGLKLYLPYTYMEAMNREAIAMPLEIIEGDLNKLTSLGIKNISFISTEKVNKETWNAQGIKNSYADTLKDNDNLFKYTHKVAKRYIEKATAVDMCEPMMAAIWLPYSIRNNRLQLMSNGDIGLAVRYIGELVKEKNQHVVYGRFGGGLVEGIGDWKMVELYKQGIGIEVIEPGRPAFSILSKYPKVLPQPVKSWSDYEPADSTLQKWAKQKKILVTIVTHAGEVSHNDAIKNFVEYATFRNIPIGTSVHYQRYTFDPSLGESMQTPLEEGGALGLVEPVLHSLGTGVIGEYYANPAMVAQQMKSAQDSIARITGKRFAPKGVYSFLDTEIGTYQNCDSALWMEIDKQGFEYALTYAKGSNGNAVLYKSKNLVVLNISGRYEGGSPFVRLQTPELIIEEAKRLLDAKKPGWMIIVLDSPLHGYSPYLSEGHKWGNFVNLGQIFTTVQNLLKDENFKVAIPHTVARYARVLAE